MRSEGNKHEPASIPMPLMSRCRSGSSLSRNQDQREWASHPHSKPFSTLLRKYSGCGEWQIRDALCPFGIWQRPHLHGRILT